MMMLYLKFIDKILVVLIAFGGKVSDTDQSVCASLYRRNDQNRSVAIHCIDHYICHF